MLLKISSAEYLPVFNVKYVKLLSIPDTNIMAVDTKASCVDRPLIHVQIQIKFIASYYINSQKFKY